MENIVDGQGAADKETYDDHGESDRNANSVNFMVSSNADEDTADRMQDNQGNCRPHAELGFENAAVASR